MANTTIKQCAEAFEEKEEVLKILLRADKETFAEFSIVDDKTGEIELQNRGLDRLEELISDKDKAKVSYKDIAEVLGVHIEAVADVVKKNEGKVFTRLATKSSDGNLENTIIRCKEIDVLVERVLAEKKRSGKGQSPSKADTKKKPSRKTTPRKTTAEAAKKESQEDAGIVNVDIPTQIALPLPESEVQAASLPEKKAKIPRKKKTKGTLTKDMLAEFIVDFNDSKALRMFMLTNLNCKPEEVALMSDAEIHANFTKNYILIETSKGTMVMDKEFVLQNLNHFFFISKDK